MATTAAMWRRRQGATRLAAGTATTLMLLAATRHSLALMAGRSQGMGLWASRTLTRSPRKVLPSNSWLELRVEPEVEEPEEAEVLPVFPLRTIEWPGNEVQLKVGEPAHQRLYQDLLLRGGRRLVTPFLAQTEGNDGPARLFAVGAVLYLEDLQDMTEKSGGRMKYVATHSVEGLARLKRVLNPGAGLTVNAEGQRLDYMRAEVEMIAYQTKEADQADFNSTASLRDRLGDVWEEIRLIAERLNEPRLNSARYLNERITSSSLCQLADLWQRLGLNLESHRGRQRVNLQVKEWILVQQARGNLPQVLPQKLDIAELGLPVPLIEAFVKYHSQGAVSTDIDFWEPLLEILVAEGPEERGALLLRQAEKEASMARARVALKDLLG